MLGQRHLEQDHESGAIAMLLAILVGTGALFALTALALDAGRQFVTHNQVQQAADSTVQAVVSKCRYTSCPTSAVMSSMLNTALASSTAQVVQACWDAGTGPETCINNTGSLVSRDSALFTSVCQTLRDYDGNPITPGGTAPYFQIVVQTRTPLSTLFNPGPAQHFRACGQGVWWSGTSYSVPKVVLLPACQFGTVGQNHVLYESPGNSGNPPATNCQVTSIDFGNGFTATPTSSWITEIGQMTDDTTCVGTDLLNLAGEPAASNRILKSGVCSGAQIRAFFNPPSPGANPRLFALGGALVSGNQVQIVAFAEFTLEKYFDGTGKTGWWEVDGDSTSAPSGVPGGQCEGGGSSGKFCMYGRFSAAVAAGHGGASAPGYAVRP